MRARRLATLERQVAERDREMRRRRREGDERTSEQRTADLRLHRAQDRHIAELRDEVARHARNATRDLVERDGRGTRRDIMRRGIWDPEDRVRRCVDCNWEIEENRCQHWYVSPHFRLALGLSSSASATAEYRTTQTRTSMEKTMTLRWTGRLHHIDMPGRLVMGISAT
jgi:hypothetical protein